MKYRKLILSLFIQVIFITSGFAQTLEFARASILIPDRKNAQLAKATQVLHEET
jgi:hypothetical protein